MKLIFCSHNNKKKEEIKKLLPNHIELLSLSDLDYHDEIEENATTFSGNALIKAQTIYDQFHLPCFADDSGLEVEALNHEPGVYSARYAGLDKNDDNNMNLVLKNLGESNNRNACFKTVICFIDEKGVNYFEGKIDGHIINEKRGNQGFGYDPIFIPNGLDKTFAEMSLDEKNNLSHRGIALQKMLAFLSK